MIRVLFFGSLRDAAGHSELRLSPPAEINTVGALAAWIARDNPELLLATKKPGMRVARDQDFCSLETPLAGAAEIAFMSPLSGG